MAIIAIPDAAIDLGDADTTMLADELDATAHDGAAFDATSAAATLRAAAAEPISFTERELDAVARALDNLRWRGRLAGETHAQASRLRDALVTPGIAYELLLVDDWTNRHGWTSWSGELQVGDRVSTRDADWRIYEVQYREGEPPLLLCQPYAEQWPRRSTGPDQPT